MSEAAVCGRVAAAAVADASGTAVADVDTVAGTAVAGSAAPPAAPRAAGTGTGADSEAALAVLLFAGDGETGWLGCCVDEYAGGRGELARSARLIFAAPV